MSVCLAVYLSVYLKLWTCWNLNSFCVILNSCACLSIYVTMNMLKFHWFLFNYVLVCLLVYLCNYEKSWISIVFCVIMALYACLSIYVSMNMLKIQWFLCNSWIVCLHVYLFVYVWLWFFYFFFNFVCVREIIEFSYAKNVRHTNGETHIPCVKLSFW